MNITDTITRGSLLDPTRQELTPLEVAAATGRSLFEVYDAISRGTLPARPAYLIDAADVGKL
ncbi:hypothetical protein SAMN05216199_1253 [Pedococcus cremeus]|uniref:Uncharacterized protein n=1 Tax=Pedococcus cremeus TaxID=587636 RepID=A0A1H9S437_9MICO|nr:hypothetical protein [Pedococcus cremeus]SER79816.1 hypothetical protein SAMN05216199_1253 [Pedococcus cremeus]